MKMEIPEKTLIVKIPTELSQLERFAALEEVPAKREFKRRTRRKIG